MGFVALTERLGSMATSASHVSSCVTLSACPVGSIQTMLSNGGNSSKRCASNAGENHVIGLKSLHFPDAQVNHQPPPLGSKTFG